VPVFAGFRPPSITRRRRGCIEALPEEITQRGVLASLKHGGRPLTTVDAHEAAKAVQTALD
jgi:hypothetical protein